jgi:hypothetical protein
MIVGFTSLVSRGDAEFEIDAQAQVRRGRPAKLYGEDAHPGDIDEVRFDWIMVSPTTPAEGPWPALCAKEFAAAFGGAALEMLEAEAIEEHKNYASMLDDRRADYEFERMRDGDW